MINIKYLELIIILVIGLLTGIMIGFIIGGNTCETCKKTLCNDCTCSCPNVQNIMINNSKCDITRCRNIIDNYVLENKQFNKQLATWNK